MNKIVLSVVETAKVLGLSRTTTYQLVNQGFIPSIRLGRRILIPIPALVDLLSKKLSNRPITDGQKSLNDNS